MAEILTGGMPGFDYVTDLVAAATAVDGQPPFSDQSLVELNAGKRELILVGEPSGAAILRSGQTAEAELVVHPDARRRGHGDHLAQEVLARADGELLVWAHGDHPAARILAERHNLEPVRQLLQMRAEVAVPTTTQPMPDGLRLDTFRPRTDDAAWLDVNAAAFASHPEQGSLTQTDLDARLAAAWFDAEDFLLLRDSAERVAAFCWLKIDRNQAEDMGEFYAVGVSPDHQGKGLGRVLVEAGMRRLAEQGMTRSNLYVEADNHAAVHLYRAYGFTDYTIDIQYRRS